MSEFAEDRDYINQTECTCGASKISEETKETENNNANTTSEGECNNKRHVKSFMQSRLLKYSLIIIGLLAILYLISVGVITWLSYKAIESGSPENITELIKTVSEYIKIEVANSIGVLSTAVICRYGLREVTNNLAGGKDYNLPDN